jgi:hypothetical protein
MTTLSEDQKQKALFITLIQQYQMQAWVSLGKLKNPVTDKFEKNLDLARLSIEMLEMLKAKTTGNLEQDEAKLMAQTISDLKLSYVSESKKEPVENSPKNTKNMGESND